MLMNLSAYRSHQSISQPAVVARKNCDLSSGKYGRVVSWLSTLSVSVCVCACAVV